MAGVLRECLLCCSSMSYLCNPLSLPLIIWCFLMDRAFSQELLKNKGTVHACTHACTLTFSAFKNKWRAYFSLIPKRFPGLSTFSVTDDKAYFFWQLFWQPGLRAMCSSTLQSRGLCLGILRLWLNGFHCLVRGTETGCWICQILLSSRGQEDFGVFLLYLLVNFSWDCLGNTSIYTLLAARHPEHRI